MKPARKISRPLSTSLRRKCRDFFQKFRTSATGPCSTSFTNTDCGPRKSACSKSDDVDLERRRIRVYRLKGGVSGEYGIFSDTARLLKAYLKTRENDFHSALFLSRKKNALSRKTIDDLFREYARKAKLPKDKRHAHTLRHSIAVHMLDAGHTQEEVKDQLGHKYIQTTDVYAAISGRKRQQIHERMERAREIVSVS